jgi:hypothetical protein
MDIERALPGQTVIVTNGRVAALGAVGSIEIPAGAIRVDGRGKFLMPGLADMHVHVFAAEEMPLYLARGITTVRNMWGWNLHLELRDRIARGLSVGPRLYTAGPIVDGSPPRLRGSAGVATAAAADSVVREQARAGYDFIKVYDRLLPSAYAAAIRTARQAGLAVVGHVPDSVGLAGVLAAGQSSIEHFDTFDRLLTSGQDSTGWSAAMSDQRMSDLARDLRSRGVWNTPTLVVFEQRDLTAEESRRLLASANGDAATAWRWSPPCTAKAQACCSEATPAIRS